MGSTGRSNMGFGSSPYASREEMNSVRRQLNYSLPPGAESITLLSISDIDSRGYGNVEYDINYRIPYTEVDSDGISHTMYSDETETRTERMKVR